MSSTPPPSHRNNFNFLRLLFASLVLVSHGPELVDGNRSREFLTRWFGTLSFGEFAVNGFFILSGFLIMMSWDRNPRAAVFLRNRVLRIAPAFVIASILSALVLAPLLVGGSFWQEVDLKKYFLSLVTLGLPQVPSPFGANPHVNGALWTIQYEFLCYILVMALGLIKLYRYPRIIFGVFIILAGLSIAFPALGYNINGGHPLLSIPRFTLMFAGGAVLYLLRERHALNPRWALVALAIWIGCMFSPILVNAAFATAGAYCILWFGSQSFRPLERFQTAPDVSYGLYLYGWPVQSLIILFFPGVPLWVTIVGAIFGAATLGYLSWILIERPALSLKNRTEAVPKPQVETS